mmetsp:Transcript_117282/g.175138  ORF Transcript_117282/g.175138 Transcript_117282/m.175138 type:complete len:150 (-) Transcript_117282:50-499(-)
MRNNVVFECEDMPDVLLWDWRFNIEKQPPEVEKKRATEKRGVRTPTSRAAKKPKLATIGGISVASQLETVDTIGAEVSTLISQSIDQAKKLTRYLNCTSAISGSDAAIEIIPLVAQGKVDAKILVARLVDSQERLQEMSLLLKSISTAL